MRLIPKIISITMLLLPVIVRGQADTTVKSEDSDVFVDVSNEPKELMPLDSLIRYPDVAKKQGIEGSVLVQALIGKDGAVIKAEVVKSTDSIFNKEAIRAIKSEKFSPALNGTVPLKLWITRRIDFRLTKKD